MTSFRSTPTRDLYQRRPDVTYNRQGNFVVVWQNEFLTADGYSYSISGRRFEAAGTLLGSELQISADTTSPHVSPAVASDSIGGFLVAWDASESVGDDQSGSSIAGRLYDGGDMGGAEFQVNSPTTGSQLDPAIVVTPAGMFATWTTGLSDAERSCAAYGYNNHRLPANRTHKANLVRARELLYA